MLGFAFLDQILDRAGHVLDEHVRVHAVLVVQVDRVDGEALQGPFDALSDALGMAVEHLVFIIIEVIKRLRNDFDDTIWVEDLASEDPSHFSQEYKQFFGDPPMRDVKRLWETATESAAQTR